MYNDYTISKSDLDSQKEMLIRLKKEIKVLEKITSNNKIYTLKKQGIKNLKISLHVLKYTIPNVIVTLGLYTGFSALHMTPFTLDTYKQPLIIEEQIDSYGNIEYENEYNKAIIGESSMDDTISYISKWEEKDFHYERNIISYTFDKKKNDLAYSILESNDIELLNNTFTDPTIKKEIKSDISEKELSKDDHILIKKHSVDKTDYIYEKERTDINVRLTISYMVLLIILNATATTCKNNKKYRSRIEEIKNEYNKSIDIDKAKEKLKILKSNYERLRG